MVSLHDLSCAELTEVQESQATLNLATPVLSLDLLPFTLLNCQLLADTLLNSCWMGRKFLFYSLL